MTVFPQLWDILRSSGVAVKPHVSLIVIAVPFYFLPLYFQ